MNQYLTELTKYDLLGKKTSCQRAKKKKKNEWLGILNSNNL